MLRYADILKHAKDPEPKEPVTQSAEPVKSIKTCKQLTWVSRPTSIKRRYGYDAWKFTFRNDINELYNIFIVKYLEHYPDSENYLTSNIFKEKFIKLIYNCSE